MLVYQYEDVQNVAGESLSTSVICLVMLVVLIGLSKIKHVII